MDEIDREQIYNPMAFGNGMGKRKGCCRQVYRHNGRLDCRLTKIYARPKCVEGYDDCEDWEKR